MFFVNSGSEAVDTALKMALQYQRLKGEATRTRLIGLERAYHGMNLAALHWAACCPIARPGAR